MSVDVRYEREGTVCKISVCVDGEAVSRLEVIDYAMRVAAAPGAWVKMGGIGNVVTHPQHRGRGYAARLFGATVEWMRGERYAVSVLFGIPNFYYRFGYIPVLPEYELSLSTVAAEGLAGAAAVRPARDGDAGALLALYERVNARRSGAVRRTAEAFAALPAGDDSWWRHPRRLVIAEAGASGEAAGYAILHGNPSRLQVLELGVPAEHVATAGASLVAWLAQEAARRRLEQIRLPLPPDDPVARFLRRAGCRVQITYPANGGGMGRIVHLAALAEALTPALRDRAALLAPDTRPGKLELVCPGSGDGAGTPGETGESGETGVIDLGAGPSITISLPQPQMCQLAMGYRSIDDLLVDWPEAVPAAGLPMVRALFPDGYPHMWPIDHF
jgi:hypothetical protein